MYSFAQRQDTQVWDEPLYGFYLNETHAKDYHPGAQQTLREMETDGNKVVEMMLSTSQKPIHFYKNMTHHLLDLDRSFLKGLVNVILTRDPIEMLPSFDAVIPNPSMLDVGYALHTELVQTLEEMGLPVIVIDSKTILLNPEEQLTKLCEAIGIPFDPAMLQWEAGARPEDGSWAQYWYKNVHQSTTFAPYRPKTKPFPEHLKPLLEECLPHYERLILKSL